MDAYSIRTQAYQGPMDVLLTLISRHKVSVFDISIATLADEFMDFLKTVERDQMQITSDFLWMASRLLALKSNSLLLVRDETQSEQEQELLISIERYRTIKAAAEFLKKRDQNRKYIFEKHPPEILRQEEIDWARVTLPRLAKAFPMGSALPVVTQPLLAKPLIGIEEKSQELLLYLRKTLSMGFLGYLGQAPKVEEQVITFICLLQLARNQQVYLQQKNFFEDIQIDAQEGLCLEKREDPL